MKRFTVLYRNYSDFAREMIKSKANDFKHYRIIERHTGEDNKYTELLLMNGNENQIYRRTEKHSIQNTTIHGYQVQGLYEDEEMDEDCNGVCADCNGCDGCDVDDEEDDDEWDDDDDDWDSEEYEDYEPESENPIDRALTSEMIDRIMRARMGR